MKLRAVSLPVLLAYVVAAPAVVTLQEAAGTCTIWQTLAVLLLGVVLPQPARLLRNVEENRRRDREP